MKLPLFHFAIAILSAGTVACSDSEPTGPEPAPTLMSLGRDFRGGSRDVTVLTRNLYVGADVDDVILALTTPDPTDDVAALQAALSTFEHTAFPLRAGALADEIARTRPHFVGLQEVSDLSVDIPPLGANFAISFLPVLQAELAARGLSYEVAAKVRNVDIALNPLPGSSVTLTDYDVILVDSRRVYFNPALTVQQNFSTNLGEVAPSVTLTRGWVAITAEVEGESVVVANTHLESGDSNPILAQVRAAQAFELVSRLGNASPAIVMGDFNDVPGSMMYQVITAAQFTDMWADLEPRQSGFTCCHLPDLSNPGASGNLDRRIDYVFARGFREVRGVGAGRAELLGDSRADRLRTPGPSRIWPSDHAGVLVTLALDGNRRKCSHGSSGWSHICR